MTIMSQSNEIELQMLKEQLRQREQQISQMQLQQSLHQQSPLQHLSSPATSSIDVPSPVYNEFQLSSIAQPTTSFDQQDVFARRKSIPRSAGLGHSAISGRYNNLPVAPQSAILPSQAVKRPRTMSHQVLSSHQMNRSNSNLSTQSASPFVCNGPITPPPKSNTTGLQPRNGAGMSYMNKDEPINAYSAGQFMMHRSQSTRTRPRPAMTGMPPVAESQLLDPETYFANFQQDYEDPSNSAYLSTSLPASQMQYSPDVAVWNMSNVSVCGSMTTGLTPDTTEMSRDNSSVFDSHSVGGAVNMVQLGSYQGTDMSHLDSPHYPVATSGQNSPLGKHTPLSDDDLNGVGSSLMSQSFLKPFSHSAEEAPASQEMSRSTSNASMASNKSATSLRFRAKETLHRQNRNITLLKPKPSSDNKTADGHSSKKDGKTAISKAKYVRPRQPKVFCDKCKDHVEGFRGEHELRRHREAKHPEYGMVKKWVCVDPTAHNLPATIPVVNPLDKCKACKAMKKYGAYYNAAAHLRRTHFKEKPSRAKNKGNGTPRPEDDKRGGKGGGDWPPMAELKNWMKEIWVNKDDSKTDSDDANEEESSIDPSASEMDIDLDNDMAPMPADYSMPQNANGAMASDPSFANMYAAQSALNANVPLYASQHLISSADFNYSCSPVSPGFPYMVPGQMQQYGSVVSSNDTITPVMANYNEAMGNVGDLQFNDMMYPQ